MKEDWKIVELGSICKVKGGKRLPKGHDLQEEVTNHPYIRARDIKNGNINFDQPVYINSLTFEKISKYIVNTGDVLLTIVGANIGDIAYVKRQFDGASLTENAVKLISNQSKVDSKFLKYALVPDYMKSFFQTVASGAAQDKLGLYKINKIKILLPSLSTQHKIAKILSAYDDLIDNNLKRIKLLEEKAQLTYEEWFIKMHFPGYKNAEFDEVTGLPKGWEFKRSETLFNIKIGKTPPREETEWFNKERIGYKWASIKDINNASSFIFETSENISIEGVRKFNMNIAKKDTVILSFKLTVGKVTIVTEDFVTNEAIAHFNQLPNTKYSRSFIYCYLKGFNYYSLGSTSSIGTAINSKIVKAIPFLVPTDQILVNFQKEIDPIFDILKNLTIQNRLLKEARDILLPRLMSGMIDVEELELGSLQIAQ